MTTFTKLFKTSLLVFIWGVAIFANQSAFAAKKFPDIQEAKYQLQVEDEFVSEEVVRRVDTDTHVVQPDWKLTITRKARKEVASKLRNNSSLVEDVIDECTSAQWASYFKKNLRTIANTLDNLAKESEVLEQRVRDQIAGSLFDAGVPISAARGIAYFFVLVAF